MFPVAPPISPPPHVTETQDSLRPLLATLLQWLLLCLPAGHCLCPRTLPTAIRKDHLHHYRGNGGLQRQARVDPTDISGFIGPQRHTWSLPSPSHQE